ERAREGRLADPGEVLDEHVPLGDERDQRLVQELVADLDPALDVGGDALGDRRCGRQFVVADPLLLGVERHDAAPLPTASARSAATVSRIARATSRLSARATGRSPRAVTIVTSFWGTSN